MTPEPASPSCRHCKRRLSNEYFFSCRRCRASFCYIHTSRHRPEACARMAARTVSAVLEAAEVGLLLVARPRRSEDSSANV